MVPHSPALLCQGGQSSRPAVHSRHANGKNGDENNDVHETVKAVETSVLSNEHEWRGVDIGIWVSFAKEPVVVVGDEQAHKE